jgi:phosphatidylinositol alpha-1,6-mannosyltransferase
MSTGSPRVLVVTNDFPPRPGGIQTFVYELLMRQPAGSVVVYTSDYAGSRDFDAALPFPVIRDRSTMLLPTPAVRARVIRVAREHGCTAAWFGAAAPLGLLAPALRSAGITRIVATTHGHEVGWALVPGARTLLGRIAAGCDVVTYLGEYTRRRLEPTMGARTQMERLAPGVDPGMFVPDPQSRVSMRDRYNLGNRPVIVCVSRLVPRKGQDVLIKALPAVLARNPDAALLLVGGGRYAAHLRTLAARHNVEAAVVFAGRVGADELPAHFTAGDLFAMPCRTRRAGMDVEGLGIVYLEASAVQLPVLAGNSGGAPDAVREGETGYVVDGTSVVAVADRIVELLANPELRRRMGENGRGWVQQEWTWQRSADRLRALLTADSRDASAPLSSDPPQ